MKEVTWCERPSNQIRTLRPRIWLIAALSFSVHSATTLARISFIYSMKAFRGFLMWGLLGSCSFLCSCWDFLEKQEEERVKKRGGRIKWYREIQRGKTLRGWCESGCHSDAMECERAECLIPATNRKAAWENNLGASAEKLEAAFNYVQLGAFMQRDYFTSNGNQTFIFPPTLWLPSPTAPSISLPLVTWIWYLKPTAWLIMVKIRKKSKNVQQ